MSQRYGIGEIYGNSFTDLSPKDIRKLAAAKHNTQNCPFKDGQCSKSGGVCSLRLYSDQGNAVRPADNQLVTTCPNRFYDANTAFKWVGETLLNTDSPRILTELDFLISGASPGQRSVGKIDMVLARDDNHDIEWCALEMQAVYFSGRSMSAELKNLQKWNKRSLPFPEGSRRPDYRSSGPKRLMPQLQIKVPTISRWGKKTAVLVDRPFWNSLMPMTQVDHVSNCDIAWFVVDYKQDKTKGFKLCRGDLYLTTLDRAVEGLTGGRPTSLEWFEAELLRKLHG